MRLPAQLNQVDALTVEPLPSNVWFKKNCASCIRHDMPFEQRNWETCLGCTIDVRVFQIEGAFNPKNRKQSVTRVQKLLDNYVELLRIFRFSEIWKEVLSMEYYGLITIEYEGKREPRNWSAVRLTQEGRKALGRV